MRRQDDPARTRLETRRAALGAEGLGQAFGPRGHLARSGETKGASCRSLGLVLVLAGVVGSCGEPRPPNEDRYVTTGSTDGLEFVARLEREAPILEQVAIEDVPRRLAADSLAREGLLKIAGDAGFGAGSEVAWVRTLPGSGPEPTADLAFEVVDRRKTRDLTWWGRVSRVDGKVVVDQVMGGGHERR